MNIVGDLPPTGWIVTDVTGTVIVSSITYTKKTIKKLEGMAAGATVNICGDVVPEGWITVSINGTSMVSNMTYVTRTIKKIDGLTAGTSLEICGDAPPAGWITTSVNGICESVLNMSYTGRTIKKISGLPVNTVLNICGDPVPAGWVATSVGGTCATVLNMSFTKRTIKKTSNTARIAGGPGDDNTSTPGAESNIIEASQLQPDVVISPNPSKTDFKVQLNGYNDNEIIGYRIFDITGRLVANSSVRNGSGPIVVGANYEPGLYLLEVTQGNTRKLIKFIKE